MKKIFIYYSLSGNGDEVASFLSAKGFEIRKVETVKPMPNNFILRILTGGFKAGINYKDELKDFDSNIDDYDTVIIGSPVWNARFSSPINTVLSKLNLENKDLKFILYSGSGASSKATALIKKNWPKADIIDLKEPKTNKDELEKLA